MDDLVKRNLLFLIGCIGSRSLLVYLAKSKVEWLHLMGLLALIPAIGFLAIYFLGLRKTGAEVFGETIWWNNLRPVHGVLWATFAYLAINKNNQAWKVLAVDTLIGLGAFLHQRKFIQIFIMLKKLFTFLNTNKITNHYITI
jgi:hypothetical protein